MKKNILFQYINIDYLSATPKYMQLANSVINAINEEKIGKDDLLPSINELSFEFEISRDTAEKGYKYLKQIGILGSVPGKGYFVKSTEVNQPLKVFLLFNKLSIHKKIMYDAFVKTLGELASIDFYIYNNDYTLFKRLIQNNKNEFTHYVIVPHFLDGGEDAESSSSLYDFKRGRSRFTCAPKGQSPAVIQRATSEGKNRTLRTPNRVARSRPALTSFSRNLGVKPLQSASSRFENRRGG